MFGQVAPKTDNIYSIRASLQQKKTKGKKKKKRAKQKISANTTQNTIITTPINTRSTLFAIQHILNNE